MIVYDKEQKQIVIPNGLGNVNIIINQGCDDDKPTPPQDGWGMTGYFNNWGGTPDIPFEEDGEWDGRPYKVIRNFEATGGEFKIRRNNAWTDSYTASFSNIPQFAKLIKGDINMSINDGVWDIYLFFGDDGVPNEMLVLNPGTDLSTIKYEYTLTISTDKENAIIEIADSYRGMTDRYYGSVTVTMKYGCIYYINVYMEGYKDISDEITCYNDEERAYTLTKIEGGSCNLINPIIFSEGGKIVNAESVEIPTFVYEGNQYYNVWAIRLDSDEAFKIQILFKPNNSGDAEPINIFGCEDSDWDNTTFGARIYQGQIYFRMSGEDVAYPYTENTWYDVEMGYNTTKRWVIVNRETLLEKEHTEFNRPNQDFMVGAIKSGGNAFRPFYGKIAAIYAEEGDSSRMWILPKEDGTMAVYVNNRENPYATLSGENNARFENDYISGDGMKSLTLFSKGGEGGSCNLGVLDWTLTNPYGEQKNASDDGYDGYSTVVVRPENIIAQEKESAINDFKNKMDEITITENGTYSIDDQETKQYVELDGNSYFDTNIPFGENTKIEVAILKTTYEEDEQIIGCANYDLSTANTYGGFGIVLGAGLAYGVFGNTKTTNIPFSMEEEQILTLDRNGIHSSFGDRTEGWIDDSRLNSNAYGLTIGIGKIKSFIDGWMYRGLKGRIRYVKIWTNKDDDSTMTLFRPKNMAQGAFGVVNSEGVETGHIENLGSGTTTFVEENVKKYPNGFKRVEVNVPDLNGSYDEGYNQGQADVAAKARVLNVTKNGVYKSKFSDPIMPTTVTGVYANGTNFYNYAELTNKIFNTKIAATIDSRLEFWYKGDKKNNGFLDIIICAGIKDNDEVFRLRYNFNVSTSLIINIGNASISINNWDDTVWHHFIVSKAEGLWIDGEKKGDFSPTNTINGEFFINGIGYNKTRNANGTFGMIKIDDTTIIPTANGFLNTNTGELLEVVKDGGYTYTENLPIYAEGELYKTINVNVVPQMDIEEEGLNVWYNDLKRIIDENNQINSDWDLALQGETIQNVFPGIAMTISGQAVAKPFFIRAVNGNSTATRIGKLVSGAYGTPVSCAIVVIGAFDCKNIQNVDLEAFKYMTDLCFIDGMNSLGESFISPQTINFTYCTNLFTILNSEIFMHNFAESLFDLSAGNKNGLNTSTLKFKNAVQERSENADAIALMRSKGWTVEFVSSDL